MATLLYIEDNKVRTQHLDTIRIIFILGLCFNCKNYMEKLDKKGIKYLTYTITGPDRLNLYGTLIRQCKLSKVTLPLDITFNNGEFEKINN